jgi:hypothetical protein
LPGGLLLIQQLEKPLFIGEIFLQSFEAQGEVSYMLADVFEL